MCGLSGIVEKNLDLSAYYKAHQSISHRGNDDEGFIAGSLAKRGCVALSGDKTVGANRGSLHIKSFQDQTDFVFGHHRLSILDTTTAGHQPMKDPTERYWILHNGEIYNYKELARELEAEGVTFRTGTDTEVLLASWIAWGNQCWARFNGMWAVAIYDSLQNIITFSRDRFGIKPLYFYSSKEHFSFASEVKFFRSSKTISINKKIAIEYLASNYLDHSEQTLYNEITQLQPGTFVRYSLTEGALKEACSFFEILKNEQDQFTDYSSAVSGLSKSIDQSITLRLRSDVNVGALLSGGVDSTIIASNVLQRQTYPHNSFHCYSATFMDKAHSEDESINETLKFLGTLQHTYVTVRPDFNLDSLKKFLWHQDFPIRSLAVYAQYQLYKEISQTGSSVVVLNGQGADEAFGGYTKQYLTYLVQLLKSGSGFQALSQANYFAKERQIGRVDLLRRLSHEMLKSVSMRGDLRSDYGFLKEKIPLLEKSKRSLKDLLKYNLQYSPLPEYLRYEDRNSMAWTLEGRYPFLDHKLVELSTRFPDKFLMSKGVGKRVLRAAGGPYCPASVMNDNRKRGFILPQDRWQRAELKTLVQGAVASVDFDFIDKTKQEKLIKNYFDGGDVHWSQIWRLACLGVWQDI